MDITSKFIKHLRSTVVATTAIIVTSSAFAGENVDYPKNYRSWSHVKSMVIMPGHALADPFEGIHHVYANEKAMNGLKTGKYRDGAVLVFDLLNFQKGEATLSEGDRKLIGVMEKDSRNFKKTGGWGFEAFKSNSTTTRLTNDGGVSCFQCHTQKENNDFVFSSLRN